MFTRFVVISRWHARGASQRTLRLADGPDEVHANGIAELELAPYRAPRPTSERQPASAG